MTRFLFIVTLLILFIFEGTIVQVFAPDRLGLSVTMVPRFVVVLLVTTALFLGRIQGLIFGLIFGLMYDIVYGSVLGVYAFSMAVVNYFSGVSFRIFQQSIFLILLTVLAALIAHEFIVYGILTLIGFVGLSFEAFIFEKLLPTLILNMIFAFLVVYPLRLILLQVKEEDS